VGSESHRNDFDANFYPLRESMRERWECIAGLCLNGASLPAVDLIQVGAEYFVRDGHHRISVARVQGWEYVDAQVTVLEVK
jgi:hypothetical protein